MRAKFGDSPEKFMESEIELNMEISELYALAASPELYPVLVGSGSLESLLGLIAHENTDISISVVGLLQELTEPTTLQETEDAIGLVDAIVALQGLELLVQNLTRLDEKNEVNMPLGLPLICMLIVLSVGGHNWSVQHTRDYRKYSFCKTRDCCSSLRKDAYLHIPYRAA